MADTTNPKPQTVKTTRGESEVTHRPDPKNPDRTILTVNGRDTAAVMKGKGGALTYHGPMGSVLPVENMEAAGTNAAHDAAVTAPHTRPAARAPVAAPDVPAPAAASTEPATSGAGAPSTGGAEGDPTGETPPARRR